MDVACIVSSLFPPLLALVRAPPLLVSQRSHVDPGRDVLVVVVVVLFLPHIVARLEVDPEGVQVRCELNPYEQGRRDTTYGVLGSTGDARPSASLTR